MHESLKSVLSVAVERHPGMVVIDVAGDLDLDGAPSLCAAIEEGRRPLGPARVIVDLSRVDFCDSTGLRALIDASREVAIAGGRLVVIVPEDGPVRRLLALTGAEEFLSVTADREQLVAPLAR
jgi:anti-sigma B factor antagonist